MDSTQGYAELLGDFAIAHSRFMKCDEFCTIIVGIFGGAATFGIVSGLCFVFANTGAFAVGGLIT